MSGARKTSATMMKSPILPKYETTRLETLRSLNILDTQPEERFDRLTRIAKRLFSVPIALVSLVDEERQWFKSVQGLQTRETPRDVSFCGHAILEEDILVIPDALLDERFEDNPLVLNDPKIRFYAGCPLTVKNGSRLGTLCLIDITPRDIDHEDRSLLRDLAAMAEQELAALQLATMDELTLLLNRRGFLALAQHTLNLCKRRSLPVCILYFDLDRFKQINDRYGHVEGDRALSAFGKLLLDTFRNSDVLGRLGGDEFAVLLSGINRPQPGLLERFQQVVGAYNEEQKRGYNILYSVGVYEFDTGHQTISELLHAADKEMYRQKRTKKTILSCVS